jgi:fructose-bisphosphate aldolase/2-amino-3,7-dideoxy-D-threo-hept-6-ulosonate synthase
VKVFGLSQVGKAIRLERIISRETKKTIIVPMDHGVTLGPIPGLVDMAKMVNQVAEGGANAVLGHIGLPFFGHRTYGRDIGLILHLTGSSNLSPNPNNKVLVATVEQALVIGADAVSIHINIGHENDSEMLRIFGVVSRECLKWGMPLVAMMYPRGSKVRSEHDPEAVKLVARVGAELGADIIKTNYTGDIDSFKEVVKGCPRPVVIAGGPKLVTHEDILKTAWEAMQAGSAGVSIGRNVFQAPNPTKMTKALCRIVHEKWDFKEAKNELETN